MPPADKTAVHRIISSRYLFAAGKSSLEILERTVYNYCRDSYTPFRSLRKKESLNDKEISEVYERFRDTIASWRGDNQCMEFHQHKHKVRHTDDSTIGDTERPTSKEEPIYSIQNIKELRAHLIMQAGRDSGE